MIRRLRLTPCNSPASSNVPEDFPTSVLQSRDVEMQDHFAKLVDVLGPEAEELGYRTVIVVEWQACQYGLDQFLLNRDREHGFHVLVGNYVVGEKGTPLPDRTYDIGPGEKIDLGCSQKERGGPVSWRVVVSEGQI
jgi:hypothetical protein